MLYAIIQVEGTAPQVVFRRPIPAGIIGARVRFVFGQSWQERSRTVVFRAGDVVKDVLLGPGEDTAVIPAEVTAAPVRCLLAGVYGTDAEGTALPTAWAELGRVHYAAEPSGDTSTDPSLPVWAQLQQSVGDLGALETEAKESLVAALNELHAARLPGVTQADEGKLLQVVNGALALVKVEASSVKTFVDDYISSALEGDY